MHWPARQLIMSRRYTDIVVVITIMIMTVIMIMKVIMIGMIVISVKVIVPYLEH